MLLLMSFSLEVIASERLKQLEQTLINSEYGQPHLITKEWYVNCKVDKINDTKQCYLFNQKSPVSLHKINSSYFINVGINNFPNTAIAMRVDRNLAVYGKNGVLKNQKIIEQMKNGKILNIRYQRWPHRSDIDEAISLDGFKEALLELNSN